MTLLLRVELGFDGQRAPHGLLPVLVLDKEEPLVLDARSARQRVQADRFGQRVRTLDPVLGTAGQVVPARRAAQVGHLTRTKLFEIVRRRHAAGVEKIFVLPDPPRPRLGALAFWRNAVDRHFRLIYGDGAILADL